MGVASFATLMAMRYHLIGNAFPPSVVKNKVFAHKFIFQVSIVHLSGVLNNPAFQLVHIFKALVFVIGTGFFAADTSGAVHDQFFVFFMLGKVLFNNVQRITKSIYIGCDGIFKMPYLAFVMVAHIYQNGILVFNEFIELLGTNMDSFIGNIKSVVVQAIGYNLLAHLHF